MLGTAVAGPVQAAEVVSSPPAVTALSPDGGGGGGDLGRGGAFAAAGSTSVCGERTCDPLIGFLWAEAVYGPSRIRSLSRTNPSRVLVFFF